MRGVSPPLEEFIEKTSEGIILVTGESRSLRSRKKILSHEEKRGKEARGRRAKKRSEEKIDERSPVRNYWGGKRTEGKAKEIHLKERSAEYALFSKGGGRPNRRSRKGRERHCPGGPKGGTAKKNRCPLPEPSICRKESELACQGEKRRFLGGKGDGVGSG